MTKFGFQKRNWNKISKIFKISTGFLFGNIWVFSRIFFLEKNWKISGKSCFFVIFAPSGPLKTWKLDGKCCIFQEITFFHDFVDFFSIFSRFWSLFPPFGTPKDLLGTSWALIFLSGNSSFFGLGFLKDPGHVPRASGAFWGRPGGSGTVFSAIFRAPGPFFHLFWEFLWFLSLLFRRSCTIVRKSAKRKKT